MVYAATSCIFYSQELTDLAQTQLEMDQAVPSLIPNSTCRSQGFDLLRFHLKVTQVRSKEKALFDKTDRDAQEIAEHINETCGLMWYDLLLLELGLGKHMTNLRPVGSYKLHKLWSNKISIKIHQMTLQDGMEGLRLALQVLCGPHNFGALGEPTHRTHSTVQRTPGI